jgi:hypothetical protein
MDDHGRDTPGRLTPPSSHRWAPYPIVAVTRPGTTGCHCRRVR